MARITPALKYPGGQFYAAQAIWANAPKHRIRIYACVGGWGEGWNWPHEGVGEIINDLDGDLINFYEVLAHPNQRKEFIRMMQVTPFSQPQWAKSHKALAQGKIISAVERAYHYFNCIRMSMLGAGQSFAPITINRLRRDMLEQVSAFLGAVEGLPEAAVRLTDAAILRLPVEKLLEKYDKKGVFFFIDPPFHPETRTAGLYRVEMTHDGHVGMLEKLSDLKHAKFMLCGYRCKVYNQFAKAQGWRSVELKKANSSSKSAVKDIKTQILWMNY